MIYFIQAIDGGPIKIGTTIQLTRRLKELCAASGEELRVLAVVDGGHAEEKSLHRRFAHCRVDHEWFEPGSDLIGFIVQGGRLWDGTDDWAPGIAVKVDVEVIRKARIVAAYKDLSLAAYLSESLRPIVDRDLEEEHARETRGERRPKGKGSK